MLSFSRCCIRTLIISCALYALTIQAYEHNAIFKELTTKNIKIAVQKNLLGRIPTTPDPRVTCYQAALHTVLSEYENMDHTESMFEIRRICWRRIIDGEKCTTILNFAREQLEALKKVQKMGRCVPGPHC